jgi:hypothetical protein
MDSNIYPNYLGNWPYALDDYRSIELELKVGYATAAEVPAALVQAILLTVGDMYENRESQAVSTRIYSSMFDNKTFRRLLANFRLRRF